MSELTNQRIRFHFEGIEFTGKIIGEYMEDGGTMLLVGHLYNLEIEEVEPKDKIMHVRPGCILEILP